MKTNPIQSLPAALPTVLAAALLILVLPAAPVAAEDDTAEQSEAVLRMDRTDSRRRLVEDWDRWWYHELLRRARRERERHWQIGSRLADAGFLEMAAQHLRIAAEPLTSVPTTRGYENVETGTLTEGQRARRLLAEIEDSRDRPRQAMERADALLREGRPGAAYRNYLQVFRRRAPEGALTPHLHRAADNIARLEERASEHMDQLAAAVDEGESDKVITLMNEARRDWEEFNGFVGAKLAWNRMANDPRVKAIQREKEAADAWRAAARTAEASPGHRGLDAVRSVARNYPRTPAGEEAAEKLRQLRADPEFMMAVVAERARSLFTMAENYRRADRHERAAELYREYLLLYPNGADADEAREALEEFRKTAAAEAQ